MQRQRHLGYLTHGDELMARRAVATGGEIGARTELATSAGDDHAPGVVIVDNAAQHRFQVAPHLGTVRVCSARYSVPSRLVGQNVDVVTHDNNVRVYDIAGCLVAEHCQCGPGETSIDDGHYKTPRKMPSRAPRARTITEHTFLALGQDAQAFVHGGAAAGVATLSRELDVIVKELIPAHGEEAVTKAITRAVRYGRFYADDIRSILQIGLAVIDPVEAGIDLDIIELPAADTRSFDAYKIGELA